MVAAGASVLSDPQKPELRCATLDDAQTLIEHLEQALPNSKWIIVHHDMSEYEN
jgi:Ser/Thr protein kinase RdoA (MazF antagonist)